VAACRENQRAVYCFEVNDGELFAFAELWERWKDPSGDWIRPCAILTTATNAVTGAVHDRMPEILVDLANSDDYDLWLDSGFRRDYGGRDVEALRCEADEMLSGQHEDQ
jgi:putative SOS response-associated peptidase YedK